MKKQFYKMMIIQLGIFLSYDFAFVYFDCRKLLFLTIFIHAISLIIFSVIHFRKKDFMKAFSFLIPFFVMSLIGIGSCGGGIWSYLEAGSMEKIKSHFESRKEANKENNSDTSRNMGHNPNSHKGQKESGIPGRRYKWLKKKPK
jgi:hypothetical protein